MISSTLTVAVSIFAIVRRDSPGYRGDGGVFIATWHTRIKVTPMSFRRTEHAKVSVERTGFYQR
jgi:lysophospholipid acyltransferase (LPLAT)-like uncharacterized protein